MKIKQTETFEKWLDDLRDRRAQLRISARIMRLAEGNPGDHKDFGIISELRIDYGPGYRVYYTQRENRIILLIAGGDKRTQIRDIKTAQKLAIEWNGE
ncbi:MAG: type II toxin-antitoxin system RelE/ParE family toxin [Coriobacteriales bacterium]|jgi:putative addiction module killer protein|nr:type II toxin-antitoxin system RelE/ParE family toxin [Coriobacteriales bacterium]